MRALRFVRASATLNRSKSVRFARAFCRAIFLPHALFAQEPSTSALFHAAASAASSHFRSTSTFMSVIATRRRLITSRLTPGAATSTYDHSRNRTSSSVIHPPSRSRRALFRVCPRVRVIPIARLLDPVRVRASLARTLFMSTISTITKSFPYRASALRLHSATRPISTFLCSRRDARAGRDRSSVFPSSRCAFDRVGGARGSTAVISIRVARTLKGMSSFARR